MVIKHLTGHLTEDGELKLNRPEELADLMAGEVEITVKGDRNVQAGAEEDLRWTEEELKEALTFHPVPANQMITGGWEDMGIEDSQAWVEEQRRKRRERRQAGE